MVVAAVVVARQLALAVDRPAELAAPDDQRVVEQPALLQVGDQGVAGLVDVAGTGCGRSPARLPCWSQPRWKICTKRTSRSASRRASRQLRGEGARLVHVGAVHVEDVLAARSRCRSARGPTSACGRPSRTGRSGPASRGRRPASNSLLVEPGERVEHAPARRRRRRPAGLDRNSTGSPLRAQGHALVLAGQEARCPRAGCRSPGRPPCGRPRRGHHHEGRQVLVHRAQAVAEPGAEAGPARELVAGADISDRRVVVDRLGPDRLDRGRCRRRSWPSRASSSLTQVPDWPCWANLYFDGAIGNRAWPLVMVVRRWPLRIESGRSLSNMASILGL